MIFRPWNVAVRTSTGNPKRDQKLQQQQDKMAATQNQERDKLQQQQEKSISS